MRLLAVGVDIGGTKTHLRAVERATDRRMDLVLPTREWRVRDWHRDARAIVDLAAKLGHGAEVAAMAVGAHGCDSAEESTAFEAAFAEAAPYPVRVVNDAELLPAAVGLASGIGLVAGTGSIAVTREADGTMLVAGGWGWVLGDEGGASGLVREAARRARYHLDTGGSMSEPLVEGLCHSFAIRMPTRLGTAIAAEGAAGALGDHAHIVFEAAASGSALAAEVIRSGADALVELIVHLKHRGARATRVVAGGAVIVSRPSLAEVFFQRFQSRFGEALSADLFPGPPVEGACRIAEKVADMADRLESDPLRPRKMNR